jgi:hypothetical protein
VLRACERLLQPGGRIAIYTIALTPGLTTADRRRGHDNGPPNVGARVPYVEMLRRAGFDDVREHDVTPAFLRVARAWNRERERHAAALIEIDGAQQFNERQRNNRRQQRAIEEGLLRRVLLTAIRR